MTDPVARNRLAALLNDAAMAAWLDHLNPQAPWPMDSMLFVADYLLTAGVLPPDVLDTTRFCRYGHPTPLHDFCAQGHPLLDRVLKAASGTPEPPRLLEVSLMPDGTLDPATVAYVRDRASLPPPAAPGLREAVNTDTILDAIYAALEKWDEAERTARDLRAISKADVQRLDRLPDGTRIPAPRRGALARHLTAAVLAALAETPGEPHETGDAK